MVEDLAVTVPAAVGGGAAARRVVPADLAEDLVFDAVASLLQQLQVRVALAVARGEAESTHAVHVHEGEVELLEGLIVIPLRKSASAFFSDVSNEGNDATLAR